MQGRDAETIFSDAEGCRLQCPWRGIVNDPSSSPRCLDLLSSSMTADLKPFTRPPKQEATTPKDMLKTTIWNIHIRLGEASA